MSTVRVPKSNLIMDTHFFSYMPRDGRPHSACTFLKKKPCVFHCAIYTKYNLTAL